jgi:hypothetical protein
MSFCPHSSASLLRIALLAMGTLMLQGVAVQSAAASCGDWLAGHESTASDRIETASPVSATIRTSVAAWRNDVAGRQAADLASEDRSAPRPCNGPDCRQMPAAPDAPLAPASTRVIVPQWLLGSPLTTVSSVTDRERLPVDADAELPVAGPSRIERPPRFC